MNAAGRVPGPRKRTTHGCRRDKLTLRDRGLRRSMSSGGAPEHSTEDSLTVNPRTHDGVAGPPSTRRATPFRVVSRRLSSVSSHRWRLALLPTLIFVCFEERAPNAAQHLADLSATCAETLDSGAVDEPQIGADRQMVLDFARRADRHRDEASEVDAGFPFRPSSLTTHHSRLRTHELCVMSPWS